jgi:hypothetical protein
MTLLRWLHAAIDRVGDFFYAAGDGQAREYGWTVERRPWGCRRYRDPRWDMRASQHAMQLQASGQLRQRPLVVSDDRVT